MDMVERMMDSFAGAVVLVVCFVALLLGCVVGVVTLAARTACFASGDKMSIEVSHSMWTGCMILVGGQWLPWSEVVPVERGGKIVFEPKPYVRLAPPEPVR